MHIRKLELHGFKSFPDRTTFHFGPGISGVVGPNGCGKSNIVDAIKWCLGEQSAKSLRGQAMQDVIFAGSADRKPSNVAEVTLHFDAGDEPFPGEWSQHPELAITRRIFRDGGSEYLINQGKVRLRDIHDLFLDSGVANRLYSFIEQGRIGEIVNARPDQRRTLIEEAAGISRYKARRKEAEQRLSGTLENLERVSDSVGALAGRMRALEKQVAKAMRYRRLKSFIRQGDVLLGLTRYSALTGDRRALSEKLRAAEALEVELGLDVQRRDAGLKDARAEAEALEAAASAVRDELAEVEASRREREQARQFQDREREDLKARIEVLATRGEEAAAARDAAATRLADVERERADVHERLSGMESELQEARVEVQSAEGAVRERRRRIEQAKSAVLDRAKALARARAEQEANVLRRRDLANRRGRLERQQRAASADTMALRKQIEQARVSLAEAEGLKVGAAESTQAARARLDTAREQEKAAREIRRDSQRAFLEAERDHAARKARAESLAAMVEGDEGADDALKTALRVDRVRGRLGALLEVPAALEAPLAAALRELLDAVVVPDAGVAADVAAVVDGRVDVVIAGEGRPTGLFAEVGGDPGAVGVLARLVDGVASVSDATAAFERWAGGAGHSVVAGEPPGFLGAPGVLRLGPPGGGAVLLSRRRELGEARASVEAAAGALDAARRSHGAAVTAAEQAGAAVDAARDALSAAQESERDAAQAFRDAERDLSSAKARLDREQDAARRTTEELEEIARGHSDLDARDAALAEQVRADESEQDRLERSLQTEQVALGDEGRTLGKAREGLSSRAAEAAALRERLVGLDRSRAEVRAARDAATRQVSTGQAEATAAETRIAALVRADAEIGEELVKLREQEASLRQDLHEARERVQERRATLAEGEEGLAEARRRREQATETRNGLDRSLLQVKEELSRIRTDLNERYEVSVVGLLDRVERSGNVVLEVDPAALRDDLPPAAQPTERDEELTRTVRVTPAMLDDSEVVQFWSEELETARAALARLGEVNLVALVEYEEVAEDHAELDQQRADLDDSVEAIRQTIARLNRISRERFRDTFERVDGWFREIYPKLVGGGQARLQLTDEEDMLDTGVDIFVQPPGKRLQNLTLLSGGETAMVAIALIFSLFRVKPSPFCLLDEVDAPLDEGNGARFNSMLRDMAALSQFILVTHNKKTMECADTLYGVTMPTAGVSRLVSVRLDG
jgi:chromosome segregation protein